MPVWGRDVPDGRGGSTRLTIACEFDYGPNMDECRECLTPMVLGEPMRHSLECPQHDSTTCAACLASQEPEPVPVPVAAPAPVPLGDFSVKITPYPFGREVFPRTPEPPLTEEERRAKIVERVRRQIEDAEIASTPGMYALHHVDRETALSIARQITQFRSADHQALRAEHGLPPLSVNPRR